MKSVHTDTSNTSVFSAREMPSCIQPDHALRHQ